MIPYYEKCCVLLAVRKSHVKALLKARNALRRDFRDLIQTVLEAYPGGASGLAQLDRDLATWPDAPLGRTILYAVLTPRASCETICFAQLRSIENLKTDFGKRHHGKGRYYMILRSFSQSQDAADEIARIHDGIAAAVQHALNRKTALRIGRIAQINEEFTRLQSGENSTPVISKDLEPILDLLAEPGFRGTLIRTKQAREGTLENVVKSTGMEESEVRKNLEAALQSRMLAREFNVVCSSCARCLARVKTKQAVAQMAKDGAVCPTCKTPVSDVSCEVCYVVTPKVSELLDGSRWMCMYIRRQLQQFVRTGRILTEVQDGPNELDLVANVDGELLLAELKDSRFSIGHAYSFVGKCSRYKPDIAIICSTEGIDEDVAEYIANTGIAAHCIESLNSLDDKLCTIISKGNADKLAALLGEISIHSILTYAMLSSFNVSVPSAF